jgi:hypothetical protein
MSDRSDERIGRASRFRSRSERCTKQILAQLFAINRSALKGSKRK